MPRFKKPFRESIMSYILKHSKQENERLSRQDTLDYLNIEDELRNLKVRSSSRVIDVGCGSGHLCSYLEKNFNNLNVYGIDIDEIRVAQARTNHPEINFDVCDIVQDMPKEKFDYIFNRLFAHHFSIDHYKKILFKFKDLLNPNGVLTIIDIDGAFVNLGTANQKLLNEIDLLKKAFPGDMEIGRKIPDLLLDVGFRNITFEMIPITFSGANRIYEAEQWKDRFRIAEEFYSNVLGGESKANQFFQDYIDEFKKESNPVFYQKFIIQASL